MSYTLIGATHDRAYLLEAAVDARLDVVAAKRQTLSDLSWHLDALLQQQSEPCVVDSACVVGHQTEQTYTRHV